MLKNGEKGRCACVPFCDCSTHVMVMPPSLHVSLKRRRNVPGRLSCSRVFSFSLVMKPMIYLSTRTKRAAVYYTQPAFEIPFHLQNGARQGEFLCPFFFPIYTNDYLKQLNGCGTEYMIDYALINHLIHADGVVFGTCSAACLHHLLMIDMFTIWFQI